MEEWMAFMTLGDRLGCGVTCYVYATLSAVPAGSEDGWAEQKLNFDEDRMSREGAHSVLVQPLPSKCQASVWLHRQLLKSIVRRHWRGGVRLCSLNYQSTGPGGSSSCYFTLTIYLSRKGHVRVKLILPRTFMPQLVWNVLGSESPWEKWRKVVTGITYLIIRNTQHRAPEVEGSEANLMFRLPKTIRGALFQS